MSTMMLDRVRAGLDFLVDTWPDLVTALQPGTRRRWTQRRPDPERAAEIAEQDRQERADLARQSPDLQIPGVHPAPLDISVLATLHRVATVADDISRAVAEVTGERRPRESTWSDPRPHLAWVRAHLAAAHDGDDRTGPWVGGQVRSLAAEVAAHRGELREGQALDALCPWCSGRTEQAPVGGVRTLVVVHPADDDPEDEALIMCRGSSCDPPKSQCGLRRGGAPAWPQREWDWLAKQLVPVQAISSSASREVG